jgi:predicted ATPase
VGGDSRFAPLVQQLLGIADYAIFPDLLREPQKFSGVRPMTRQGDNWASVLKDASSRAWRAELVAVLARLTDEDIDELRVQGVAGYLVVQFRHRVTARDRPGRSAGRRTPAKWFDAGQESDGTLRVAGIVTACLQEPPVAMLGVEEPELTVHPGAIPLLVDELLQASERSQVLITTHSPEVLDRLAPTDVRVVTRVDGATAVSAMDLGQAESVRRGLLTLGEVHRNEGIAPELPFLAADSN